MCSSDLFSPALDVPNGGVLFALPALLAVGLLAGAERFFALPKGYYGLDSLLVLLAFMALGRLKSVESLRYCAPGEWGKLLGLDRVPEVRTLRRKIRLLTCDDQAEQWSAELCKRWMDAAPEIDRLQPDVYAVNEDGDKPEKRAFCEEHGLEYAVLKRAPEEGLPRRQSTDLRGF